MAGFADSLELLPARPEYAEPFLRWRKDPVAQRFNPFMPMGLEACRDRLSREGRDLSAFGQTDAFRWFVRRNGEIAGTVSVSGFNRMMLLAEIGYLVAPEHRGRGVGAAAVRLLIDQLFPRTPLRKLIAFVQEDNLASRRLLERLGFSCEGLLREHYLVQGKPVNEVLYGLLAREWRGSEANRSSGPEQTLAR